MPHIEIAAEKISSIFGLPITNSLLMSWLVVGILLTTAWFLSRHMRMVPSMLQNIVEILVESFLNLIEGVFGSREEAEKQLPLIVTIFIFILLSNWLGIMPGIGSIGFNEKLGGGKVFVPLLRSSASDLNFTLALAVLAVVMVNIMGIRALGLGKYFSKYFNFKGPIEFGVGLLELVSEFSKMISFSFRLFGNVFAGEVLLIIVAFLAPFAAPIPFLMLEIFVGFVQALVFAMLTMVFISIAVAHH